MSSCDLVPVQEAHILRQAPCGAERAGHTAMCKLHCIALQEFSKGTHSARPPAERAGHTVTSLCNERVMSKLMRPSWLVGAQRVAKRA